MRIHTPANVHLMRAQVILILGALVPTILTTPLGIILLATGEPGVVEIVSGVLVLTFAASSLTGFVIGGIFLRRGAALVKVQQDFLSSVSHELRTPMTSMRMFVEALLDDRLTDATERARCLRLLGQEIDRLDGLVGELIQLSRLEIHAESTPDTVIPLAEVIEGALQSFETIRMGSEVHLECNIDDDLLVVGDATALVQVVVNLLSNAHKYTGDEKIIRLGARAASEKEVELTVEDNGPGIPAAEQEHVFDKFWRGQHAVESNTPGSGLGLAIVAGIVRAHGGRIELSQPEQGGAGFHVFLPRGRHLAAPDQP